MGSIRKVLILGAGPAGLAAAWKLAEQGIEVDCLEREADVGGLCRSIRRNGYVFDLGGHRFITKDEEVLKEILALMGDELETRPRKSVIRLRGRYFNYPLEIGDLVRKMDPVTTFRSGLDFLLTKIRPAGKPDVTFEDWVVRRFGRTMYDIYFGPYSEKLWGLPPRLISSDWAAQRISLINLWDVLFRMLGRKKDMPKTYAMNFLYPRQGIGRITDRMAEEIRRKGGRIHCNAAVTTIRTNGDHLTGVGYRQDGVQKEMAADYVINTIPLPGFLASLEPAVDTGALDLVRRMKFRGLRFLFLTLDRPSVTDNAWIYVPEKKYLFFRIQEIRNWSPAAAPEGKTGLTLEIACNEGDEVWNLPEKEAFEQCMDGLEEMGLIRRSEVLEYFSEKVAAAYPIYSLQYRNEVTAMYRLAARVLNLLTIGRQGLYRYNNMDHSLKMGLLAARHVVEGLPVQSIMEIATENIIFDWQDPGYHGGTGGPLPGNAAPAERP